MFENPKPIYQFTDKIIKLLLQLIALENKKYFIKVIYKVKLSKPTAKI